MNTFKVYAAGPMEGMTVDAMTGWRNDFKVMLNKEGMVMLDPCRRMPYHNGDSINIARSLFKMDLMDIDNSDAVFFDMRRVVGKAWGTSMEMMYAWTKDKPLVVRVRPEEPKHPFIEAMATATVYDLCEAIDTIKSLADSPVYNKTFTTKHEMANDCNMIAYTFVS